MEKVGVSLEKLYLQQEKAGKIDRYWRDKAQVLDERESYGNKYSMEGETRGQQNRDWRQ